MYQQITIVGNVGRDPELKYTKSGVAVCDFSVATNKRFTGADGEKRDETTWFRVTVWRQQAEIVNQYLRKGGKVLVVGEVKASAYIDKNNQPVASLEITANEVRFLSGRDENSGESGGGGGNRYDDDQFAPPTRNSGGNRPAGGRGDDEIPF